MCDCHQFAGDSSEYNGQTMDYSRKLKVGMNFMLMVVTLVNSHMMVRSSGMDSMTLNTTPPQV